MDDQEAERKEKGEGASDASAPPQETRLTWRPLALWRRMRSRKVVQWSVAYAVVAFALLQGLALIADTFGWPTTVGRIAIVVLLVGLPVSAIVAWFHGDRDSQRVTRIEAMLIVGCIAVGAALVPLVLQPSAEDEYFTPSNLPRLAVLRFESLGQTEPFFSETLADELISELSHINGLDVIARASSYALEGDRATPAIAAHDLRANVVLTGSVANLDGRVHVSVQLAEAPSGRQLWSASFERPTEDIPLLRHEIAANVARASGLRLQGASPRRVNREAYQLYLRGREAEQPETGEAYQAAKSHYEAAVASDPNFTEAWAALARVTCLLAYADWRREPIGAPRPGAAMADAVAAADRATELDPALASPYETRARVMRLLGRWSESLSAAEAARERGGADAGVVYMQLGYFRRAESLARRAVELDPLSATQITYIGVICGSTGRYDCAIDASERAYRLAPDNAVFLAFYAQALAAGGRNADALRLTHTRPDLWQETLALSRPMDMAMFRVTLGAPGPRPSVRDLMRAYDRGEGDMANIISVLERTGQVREIPPLLDRWSPGTSLVLYDRDLAPVRASPQFWAAMEREGMLQVWREKGWPDFCEREPVCEAHRR